ncbi:MAG: iaaA [Planctomycetaceae bacterium]|nr:iaaA [Planctomycetaceae bacterium]
MLNRRVYLTSCLVVLVGWGLLIGEEAKDKVAAEIAGLPLLYQANFEDGKTDAWAPSDANAWKIEEVEGNKVLSQFQQSKVQTPVRSPFNRSVIKDLTVSDFVLDVKLQSTARDYPHRSLCLFFGYQDPAHLYYVHFGQKTDDHANQIFIVNNEPRKKISTETTPGTAWDDKWHHARIVRKVESGTIEVYFDDMEKPVMKAIDKNFTWGEVGVGSFDDTGRFDRVLVYGKKAAKP